MNEQIQQELALADQRKPGRLEVILDKIEHGQIDGSTYKWNTRPCGCFYGWLSDLDSQEAVNTKYAVLGDLPDQELETSTPIEVLIQYVKADDLPHERRELATLRDEIISYLSQKEASHP